MDRAELDPLGELWQTTDTGDFAEAAERVAGFQDGLHKILIGLPTEKASSRLGFPDPTALGFVAEQIPVDSVDEYLSPLRRCIEIVGIAVGVAAGNPVLACASFKALVHDELHRLVVAGIKEFIIHPPGG